MIQNTNEKDIIPGQIKWGSAFFAIEGVGHDSEEMDKIFEHFICLYC